MSDKVTVKNQDLVLTVSNSVDPHVWDEGKYYQYVDRLCGNREYQKEAIFTALRYLLGGQYSRLESLAHENWQTDTNEAFSSKFSTFENFKNALPFPEKLAGSLDIATGAGKSYVLYGIATIMLAEGNIDRVLVLCPSTTIETGLTEKFKDLALNSELNNLLDIPAPRIINGSESLVSGSICIENFHQILENSSSSIRDSLSGKGEKTLVLNDETHHVYANENGDPEKKENLSKWKAFLGGAEFGFKYIIGVSGTCYIKDNYFSDVIYRYSLRQAIEDNYVKSVQYIAKSDDIRDRDQKWQIIVNRHIERVEELKGIGILPITIVVTQKINACNLTAAEFKNFLKEVKGLSDEEISEKVLVVHGKSKENYRLRDVDNAESKIEWIFSVSMLTEGWDVKRVFQIVPHEERAFNSKLLIAQVMGRGLRVPVNWPHQAGTPKVTIFNHEAWANSVLGIVNDVLEYEKKITSLNLPESPYNFELLNVEYTNVTDKQVIEKTGTYKLFEKGYVDLATTQAEEEKYIEYSELVSGTSQMWTTKVTNKTYSVDEMAQTMYERLGEEELASEYQKEFPIERLTEIINKSLEASGNSIITDQSRQKLLQSLGTIKRGQTTVVKIESRPDHFNDIKTQDKMSYGSVSASGLHRDKFIFYTNDSIHNIPAEDLHFFEEILDPTNRLGSLPVMNTYDFKTPLNFVIADSNNELKFIAELVKPENAKAIDKWIKSPSQGLYGIDYSWRKGEHNKNGRFNADFFIVVNGRIIMAEIKGDEQVSEPDPENIGKNKAAVAHIKIVNEELQRRGSEQRYKFTFITPSSYGALFDVIKSGDVSKIDHFTSNLDLALL